MVGQVSARRSVRPDKRVVCLFVAQETPVFTELKRETEEEKGRWTKRLPSLAR